MTREEAIAELKAQEEHVRGMSIMGREAYYMAIEALKQQDQNKGKWIEDGTHSVAICSQCNASNLWKSPYCPYCGAEMKEGQ